MPSLTAAQMRDVDSRFMLQTSTKTQPWDQVTAISQKLINDNFKNLVKMYPKMGVMDSHLKKSRIQAKLHAPRVLIPAGSAGSNSNEVLFLMSFESGTLYDADGSELIDNLTDWVIAFSISLNKFTDDEEKKPKISDAYELATQTKHVESLRKSLTIDGKQLPGDYSVERLYAKLSSAKFNDPDKTHSQAVVDGKVISWDQWAVDNFDEYHELRGFLEKWAIEQDKAGRNVFGYGIKLKKKPTKIDDPTFVPTDLVHQTYTYKQADTCKEGSTGDTLLGSRNALLYCEMVDGHERPDDHSLIWSGNFCTMPSTPDAKDAIEGTFILNHQQFMERFLLSKLRLLNQATEVCHGLPYGYQEDTIVPCPMPYNVSYDPQNPSITSACYDFKNLNPNNLTDLPNGYRYHKVNFQPQPVEGSYVEFKNQRGSGANLKGARVRNEMSVDVTWQMGSPTLVVKGTVTTEEIAYWDQGGDIKPGDPATWDPKDLWAWQKDKFTATWDMTLTLQTIPGEHNNGILDADIKAGPNNDCNFQMVPVRNHHNMDENGHFESVAADLKKRFSAIVPTIVASIKQSLQGSGRFFFPGSGIFSFKDPRFTKWGDLVAEINYLPLKEGSMILIPTPVDPLDVPPPSTKPKTNVLAAPVGSHMLTWSTDPTPCSLAPNKIGKLVFRGENKQNGAVGLKEIRLLFTAKKKSANLFYTDNFYIKGGEPVKKVEETKTTKSKGTTTTTKSTETSDDTTSTSETLDTTRTTDTTTTAPDASNPKSEKDFVVVDTPEKASESTTTESMESEAAGATKSTANKVAAAHQDSSLTNTQIPPATAAKKSSQADGDSGTEKAHTGERTSVIGKIKSGVSQILSSFLPSGEPDFGVVSIRHGSAEAKPTVKVICQNAKKFKDAPLGKWQITVDDESDTLYLQPGEWIEVVIEARSNMPALYKVTVDEEFVEPKDSHWSEEITVKIN